MMPLEDFVATGRSVDNLATALVECEQMEVTSPGRIYVDSLWIERTAAGYSLLIGNVERESNDLAELERHLHQFAGSEGYI
jgi:hypothetical protein